MFKYKKCILKFQKSCQPVDYMNYRMVTDSCLMSVLLELQEKYGFEIISTDFKDVFEDSNIKIKCKKEDKHKIFGEYCVKLGKQICNISF